MNLNTRVNSKGQIIEELDVHLVETKEPVKHVSLEKFIYNHEINKISKINDMEILTWCEIYLAAKKRGTSLFDPSSK